MGLRSHAHPSACSRYNSARAAESRTKQAKQKKNDMPAAGRLHAKGAVLVVVP